ncbi:carbohydrate ABC transporter ATP-binding protein (CUT1 family) [Rhizobium sp. ERR 922]|uniref:ABC transporter ATP-binding protein n=1 Tax=Rhizobium dioscoreae TaxID=2653122 RepID=A0ABQ0YXS4_9HYPH|nr:MULTISPECIES: sn-glycerol-3-phosphate ABC transporter ATP-binding protein UgpC [Rhizobium]TWB17826.1 carbohydrate ABC transporter ATP-binding protein (CUT1 family) [Rhizobium sp. ERR1071]TWB61171.1 carbohydrate ABC transporter ATP-binding protein (CUT1 family) [Rhizobium sp. ERR 922]TWC04097.1 carbohydrate ABC transporter ATP-binding protein (CUT1 family) [Rhizobium sp. ERR 942]GES46591.1 ABC transporter ATP-binding protein [Rhizobium dioscoreae]GES47890.1 ABC transporter ATP-binding protei
MAGINIKSLTKHFGAVQVLNDIDLTIERGEFVVFLGGSGCGKSTLLRMIAGLETITSGEIWIGGKRVDQLPPGERGVSMVFQSYALYPHMTVRENMSFGLKNIKTPKHEIARRIEEAAKILEMPHLLDRKPSALSGGQRQRVAIGRAIVREPDVFLFDEPLSNLDAGLRTRTRVELAQLHERLGATMVFVTHDQVEAMTLADRIVLLNNKKIEQVATPVEIYTRPATRYVAQFVGSPGMNFINIAGLDEAGGLATATLPDGSVIKTAVALNGLANSGLTLGIRPEHLVVTTAEKGDIGGQVETVERLGDRSLVHVRLKDGSKIIGTDPGMTTITTGSPIAFAVEATKVSIFDEKDAAHHSVN